jgi:hypothetical protein
VCVTTNLNISQLARGFVAACLLAIGDWQLGIGDWQLAIRDW